MFFPFSKKHKTRMGDVLGTYKYSNCELTNTKDRRILGTAVKTWQHSDWKVALPPFNPKATMFLLGYPEPTASYSSQPRYSEKTWRHSDWKVAVPPFNPNAAMFLLGYPEPTASYSSQPCIRSKQQKFAGWYSNNSLDHKRFLSDLPTFSVARQHPNMTIVVLVSTIILNRVHCRDGTVVEL